MTTETDPRRDLAELEARILEGDLTVSPTVLAKARQAAELAELHDEAARRQAEREASDNLERRREAARAEYLPQLESLMGDVRAAYTKATEGLAELAEAVKGYQTTRRDAIQVFRRLKIGSEVSDELRLTLDRVIDLAIKEGRGRPEGGSSPRRLVVHSDEHFERLRASKQRQRDREQEHRRRREAEREALRAERDAERERSESRTADIERRRGRRSGGEAATSTSAEVASPPTTEVA